MLTENFLRSVTPQEKPRKYADGGGLFIYVTPRGSRLWRMAYRYNKKSGLLSFGKYPAVSLKMARKKREETKRMLAEGIDPAKRKKTHALEFAEQTRNIFASLALEWHKTQTTHLTSIHYRANILNNIRVYLLPPLGPLPVSLIEPRHLLAAIQPVADCGKPNLARILLEICGRIFRFAIATGRATHNVALDVAGALPAHSLSHRAAILDARRIGRLLLDMESYHGSPQVRNALQLLPMVFTRSGELTNATWEEINFERREWRIPASRMKMREPHIVPLSTQAMAIVREMHKSAGPSPWLFPSVKTSSKPLGCTTLLKALRRLGYGPEEQSIHGFRSIASTLLNEMGYNTDWIERQLAHQEHNGVRAAYNYAQYLPQRRKMMQAWSDYLDGLKEKARKRSGRWR